MGPEFAALVARRAAGERFDVRVECARLGVSPKTFYKYLKRFEAEGVQAFYPRSRRPRSSPTQVSAGVEDAVVRARKVLGEDGWDAGAEQIAFWLSEHPDVLPAGVGPPSRATINRILDRRGLVIKVPKRRPRRSRHRFQAQAPNTMWQMDGFEVVLADGSRATVLELVDDCSRLSLALRAATSENGAEVWDAVTWAVERYGLPRQFLTDNGSAFSGRRRGWTSNLEENLRALGVVPITSSLAHPQTCGKCERAHATCQKWLAARPAPATLTDLQTLLDTYREHYNTVRRKTHLDGLTPAARYTLGPKDGPGDQPTPWPVIIKTATVSASGCIGVDGAELSVGRKHTGHTVTVIRQHRQLTVLVGNQLIAEHTLTGHRGYQRRTS